MPFYRHVVRPLLFRLSSDRSHALAQFALRCGLPWRGLAALSGLAIDDPRLRTSFAGIELANPVGLAAGFDKNGDLLDALSSFGFGFLTIGSVMPETRFGNPFPRLVRYPEREALADAMGVPSKGRNYAVERFRRFARRRVPIFANIGGFSAADIAASLYAIEPHVDATEISLMCPNVTRENFDELRLLREVLDRIGERRKPTIVRIPNDTAKSPDRLAELIECCIAAGVAGLKVGGGRPVDEPRLGAKQGTLHGPPIFATALANVERTARLARGRIQIKGNGGISSAGDVQSMLQAGACCVDLYSAFIYQGWSVARRINLDLLTTLDRQPLAPLSTPPRRAAGMSAQ